jgi:hypothetical protein
MEPRHSTSRYRCVVVALALSAISTYPHQVGAEEGTSEWPYLRLGIWEFSDKKVQPSGSIKTWKTRRNVCRDTRVMFWNYWGGELDRGGCSHRSAKLSDTTFKITSECEVKGRKHGTSEALVTLANRDEFETDVTVREGTKVYRGKESGRRIADCPPEKANGGS